MRILSPTGICHFAESHQIYLDIKYALTLNISIENLYFRFSPAFKIIKYREEPKNTLRQLIVFA